MPRHDNDEEGAELYDYRAALTFLLLMLVLLVGGLNLTGYLVWLLVRSFR
jgi:hypothetical protein